MAISLPKGSYVPVFETRTQNRAEPPRSNPRWKITALACAAVAVIAVWWSWRPRDSGPVPLRRFEIELRSEGSLGGSVSPDVSISPDGSRLVFIAQDTNGVARLYTLPLDEGNAAVLEGTEGARDPFFSPDGQWIAFQRTASSGKSRQPAGLLSCCAARAIPTAEVGVRTTIFMLCWTPLARFGGFPVLEGAP